MSSIVLVGDLDQLLGNTDLSHAVTRIRNDGEITVRHSLVKLIGAGGRTHHIVPALDYVHRNVLQLVSMLQNVTLIQKYPVDKVVTFNPSKCCSKVLKRE